MGDAPAPNGEAPRWIADGAWVRAFLDVANGLAPMDIARAVYGSDADAYYVREKAGILKGDIVRWLSSLDSRNLSRFGALVASRVR